VIVVLALMGVDSLARPARGAVAPLRPARLAIVACAAFAVVLSAPASEAWFWPWAADGSHAPRPAAGAHELASCYVGHQLLTSIALQPGTSLVLAGGANGMARCNTRSGGCPWQPTQYDNIWDLDFSTDGTRLAVASFNARIVDTRTWKPYPGPVAAPYWGAIGTDTLSASFDPAGERIAYAATGLQFVGVYDLASRNTLRTAALPVSPLAIRWSPDGSTIAVGANDGILAAGDQGGTLYRWDLRDGLPVPATVVGEAHGAAVRSLSFSLDGSSLAPAGSDHLAKIWTADGLRLTRVLSGDTAAVWGVAWSPDSREVVTASADGSVGLWAAR
jgi:WD40 repeat protein